MLVLSFMMLVFKIIFKLKNKKQKIVFFSILLKINVFDKLLFFIFKKNLFG